MTNRKKKIRILQIFLLMMGLIIIFYTYFNQQKFSKERIIPKEIEKKVKNQNIVNSESGDVFYNIEYSGLDLAGNRYILKSKEAVNNENSQDVVDMKFVEAVFYFKDDTVLNVWSDSGLYNNRTLDMNFYGNVKAKYEGSELFAEKAEYSNSKGYLVISEKVKVKDLKGTMVADELLFDIKNQTLDIASFNDSKINANVNLK